MHHFRSNSSVIRLRLSAFLLISNYLLAAVAAVLLVHSMLVHDTRLMLMGAGIAGLCLLLLIIQWTASAGARCPLCRTPVLAPKSCMKHRRARALLGSHRLRVAMAVLFSKRFRCPYCNESTTLELRERLERTAIRRIQPE